MPTDRNLVRQEVSTYAEVLLEGARSEGAVFEVGTQLAQAAETITGNVRLRDALRDETIPAASRCSVVRELFASDSPSLLAVLCVMVERGDLGLLRRFAREYSELAEHELGAVVVDVTTAVPLDDHLRDVIKEKLSKDFGSRIVLREHVDKDILGGIIMSAHGNRIDASLSTQVERARNTLSNELSGGDE